MQSTYIVAAAMLLTLTAGSARAQFDGVLELIPPGCEQVGLCKLKNPLRFTDSAKVVWEARAGLPTDGASIPGIFQPFVGSPFDPAFIRAAVIHDHYCDRHVRPWTQTHGVFYEGLIAGGVSLAKAKTMYFAVFLGGPKWIKLKPGNNCGIKCVNNFMSTSGVAGVYSRRADYSAADVAPSIQSVSKLLDLNPDSLSLDDLEKLARKLRPGDFFYKNGDSIDASLLGVIE
jgi:Protein of unknown function (DUF1353)